MFKAASGSSPAGGRDRFADCLCRPLSRASRAGSRSEPRLDQSRRAIVTNEGALLGDESELNGKAQRGILIEQTRDETIAALTSVVGFERVARLMVASEGSITGHLADLRLFGGRYILPHISIPTSPAEIDADQSRTMPGPV
jgi:hypothetical protein